MAAAAVVYTAAYAASMSVSPPSSSAISYRRSSCRYLISAHSCNNLIPRFNNNNNAASSSISISFPSSSSSSSRRRLFSLNSAISGGDGGGIGGGGGNGGGGGGNDGEDADDDGGKKKKKNKADAMLVLEEIGRGLDALPKDLRAAVEAGKIPKEIVLKYFELEKSTVFRWLLQFGGFRERLLADDLFLAKVGMECGVGMFTKTLAEYNQRKENFFNEIEVVCADVVMAVIADFMLVYLPAPTVSLRSPIALNAGPIAKYLSRCPDNAFQIALGGTSYTFLERIGAIVRNGAKLFVVGTTSSLVGTAATNIFINARKVVEKSSDGEVETVPVLSTSVGYGVYMAVSSNLRYQILAGIIEQRLLEPMLHQHKLILSALCFAVRTGNTYLGSLLWVDYARWVGFQKAH